MIQLEKIKLPGAVFYPQLRCLRKRHQTKPFVLGRRQADLLEALALCEGTLVTNDMLMAVAYGRRNKRVTQTTLVAAISRLKQKLKRVLSDIVIYQIRGFGYKLVYVRNTPRTRRVRGFSYRHARVKARPGLLGQEYKTWRSHPRYRL